MPLNAAHKHALRESPYTCISFVPFFSSRFYFVGLAFFIPLTNTGTKRISVARSSLEQQAAWCLLEIFMSTKARVPDTGLNPRPSE